MLRRIPIRICAGPAVVLNCRVQGLRSIRHIVAQDPRHKNNLRLNRLCVLVRRGKLTIIPHRRLHPLVPFARGIRLQAHLLRRKRQIQMRLLRHRQRTDVVIALPRQRNTNQIGIFHIDKVFRRPGDTQLRLSLRLPMIRLRPVVLHGIRCRRRPQKLRHILRQPRHRQTVDHPVPIGAPRRTLLHQQHRHHCHSHHYTNHRTQLHRVSIKRAC